MSDSKWQYLTARLGAGLSAFRMENQIAHEKIQHLVINGSRITFMFEGESYIVLPQCELEPTLIAASVFCLAAKAAIEGKLVGETHI